METIKCCEVKMARNYTLLPWKQLIDKTIHNNYEADTVVLLGFVHLGVPCKIVFNISSNMQS